MPADIAQVTVTAATIRRRFRRGSDDVDGRSALARRTKSLITHFVAELGGPSAVSPVQMLKVRRAGELVVTAELMRTASLRGERVDPLALVRLENLGARAVAALDLPTRRRSTVDMRPAPYDIQATASVDNASGHVDTPALASGDAGSSEGVDPQGYRIERTGDQAHVSQRVADEGSAS
jgi:hypothetical protein